MDRSLGTTAQPRIQDVTPQILKIHNIYGSSDYTNPAYAASNRSLNYHEGGSIHRPELDRVTIIPYTLRYQDTVGLFGKENHFIRVNININRDRAYACFSEPGWECALIYDSPPETDGYESALIDYNSADSIDNLDPIGMYDIDGGIYNPDNLDPLAATIDGEIYAPDQLTPDAPIIDGGVYEEVWFPAEIGENNLPYTRNAFVSIELKNLKVGNKFIDDWFDVRLYRKDRKEHPYDKMYVRMKDFFYIGFHARNTKRLPYNVECVIGEEYLSGLTADDERYLNR